MARARAAVALAAVALALAVALAVGGCGSGSPAADATAEQYGGMCPSPSRNLVGTTAAGGACASAQECAPTCCTCAMGGKSFLAASCAGNACAKPADACAAILSVGTNATTYCGP